MRPAMAKTIKLFFKTTTLHGFKYLYQGYHCDRVVWAAWCVGSMCCAGLLCTVVWARFTQVPALLALRDLRVHAVQHNVPVVALCPAHAVTAKQIFSYLSLNPKNASWLPTVLSRLLGMRRLDNQQINLLENLLDKNNVTLKELLMKSMPECGRMARKCRWKNKMVDCATMFEKITTDWGVCCLLNPEKLIDQRGISEAKSYDLNESFWFSLECSLGHNDSVQTDIASRSQACELITKYHGEEWTEPTALTAGHEYHAMVRFVATRDPDDDALVDGSCVSDRRYSLKHCKTACRERSCGCLDPLRLMAVFDHTVLPPCSPRGMGCLRVSNDQDKECSCKPACRKQISLITVESTPLNALRYVIGSMYENLTQSSTVLNIRVRISDSRLFVRLPTESWLTLLSSLGGVFNMFMGVGLFSALELVFLMLVRLPLAIRRSTDRETSFHSCRTPIND